MRIKYTLVFAIITIFFSCASKQVTPPPVIAPSPEELKVTQTAPVTTPKPVEIVAAPVGPSTETVTIAEGKMLYENNCAKCHRLFGPKEFTNDQWKPLVLSMQKNTPLKDFEIAKVLTYVTSENK